MKLTPQEFATKEGFSNSPHFPMIHVNGLMERYSKHIIEEFKCNLKETFDFENLDRKYEDWLEERLQVQCSLYDELKDENLKISDYATKKMNENAKLREALEAAKQLLHLHSCEQEGLSSGQPTPEQWFKAVNELSEALSQTE